MTQEPRTVQERALELLRATFATSSWLPTTEVPRLVWAIRGAILLGLLVLIASAVDKTFWDWLRLLIVPVVLGLGAYLFTRSENQRTLDQADHRRQEDVLQTYLDQMRQLLLDKDRPLRQSNANSEARTAARVGTLTTLERIQNPDKKGIIVQFLGGCNLLEKQNTVGILEGANLKGADLREAKLIGANLRKVDLGPDLRKTKSERAKRADLSRADLNGADLSGADLSEANLFLANLSGANMSGANLREADLSEANLNGANLREARRWTLDQLSAASYLEGATMPDGSKHP